MHKVIGFELKKMVSRPGIYILALLLAGLLTVTAFIYKPTEQKKTYYTLNGTTVVELANNFEPYKTQYDNNFEMSLTTAQKINEKKSEYYQATVKQLYLNFEQDVATFNDSCSNSTISNSTLNAYLDAIHNAGKTGSLDLLYNTLREYLGEFDNDFHPAVTLKENYNNMLNDITLITGDIEATVVASSKDVYISLGGKFCGDYTNKIKDVIDNLIYPNYSSFVKQFVEGGNYYNITFERRVIIIQKMNDIVEQSIANSSELAKSKTLIAEYNDLFNEYRLATEIYSNLLQYNINNAVLDNYSATERLNVKYFDEIDFYTNKENLTKYTHYIETDTNEYSYANPLSFDYSSNEEKNAYDYSYYALSLFGVILIAFAITFASHSIAGETKEGTMRFVSIRPVSRRSLILGKFFSIAIISLVMLVFSAVASMVVGGFMFGMESMKILSVINATKILEIHPMLSLAIFVGSLYIKILVYTSIAMLFTSFLKSDLLALTLTLLIYIVHLMLPMFFGANSWLRFNPLCSIDLFAFLGSGTTTAKTILGQMFTSTIYSGVNIWLSIIFIVALIVVLNLISVFAFKKREL